jgi:hypothetical protein
MDMEPIVSTQHEAPPPAARPDAPRTIGRLRLAERKGAMSPLLACSGPLRESHAPSAETMTYDLRRLRLHGIITPTDRTRRSTLTLTGCSRRLLLHHAPPSVAPGATALQFDIGSALRFDDLNRQ